VKRNWTPQIRQERAARAETDFRQATAPSMVSGVTEHERFGQLGIADRPLDRPLGRSRGRTGEPASLSCRVSPARSELVSRKSATSKSGSWI